MTAAEQRAELLAALDAARRSRDSHRAAAEADDETVLLLERVLTATALTTPVLREPEPVWAWAGEIAQRRKVAKGTVVASCRRAVKRGDIHLARKIGGRWQGRLDLMAPACGRSAP